MLARLDWGRVWGLLSVNVSMDACLPSISLCRLNTCEPIEANTSIPYRRIGEHAASLQQMGMQDCM